LNDISTQLWERAEHSQLIPLMVIKTRPTILFV